MLTLRSLLSVPADHPEEFEAACQTTADGLCLDLEDAVPAARKAAARAAAAAFLHSYDGATPVWVRVNALDTDLCASDLSVITSPGLAGIQLPKVETPHDMRTVDRLLKRHERSGGLRSGCISVIATIESAIGLRNAFDIASAADRLVGLIPAIGAGGDLQRDLGYTTTVDQRGLLYARSRVVLAARAAGVVPLDGVHVGLDLGSFERSARAARVLGYRGKKIFHHAHVKAANRIFDL